MALEQIGLHAWHRYNGWMETVYTAVQWRFTSKLALLPSNTCTHTRPRGTLRAAERADVCAQ